MKNIGVRALLMGMLLMTAGCGTIVRGGAFFQVQLPPVPCSNCDNSYNDMGTGPGLVKKGHGASASGADIENLFGDIQRKIDRPDCLKRGCELVILHGNHGTMHYCREHKCAFLEGFMGHATITIKGGRLVQVFPYQH